jgi:hypothetical protein
MSSSYRQIIYKILKEEKMSENSIARLLEWYKSWDSKLTQSITDGDYAKVIDTHFKNGVYLLSALKNAAKNSSELRETLKEEIEIVRTKVIVIYEARKSIDTIK